MKQIKDYPNYSITEDGVIFSNITNKVLTPFNSNGYLRIGLSKDNKRNTDIKKAGVYGKHTIKYAQKANEKIVLDTQTGIFYDSIKEAASILGINYWNIAQYLSGKRKNKTSLIYA